MNYFYHKGSLGDIIYSLPSIIFMNGGILCLRKKPHYNFLYSLLKKQDYLNDIFYEKDVLDADLNKIINLDEFRNIHKNDLNKHLIKCHLEVVKGKVDLSTSWLSNIDPIFKSKIIINRTPRYHNKKEIKWEVLEKYKKYCLFLGTEKEYKLFLKKYKFDINYYKCKDALEIARIIKGSKIFIGNQSLCFSLAEAIKCPRILEVYYGKNNCQPQSSNGHTYLNEKLINYYLDMKN